VTGYHLAQLNVGLVRAPIDSPELAGFMAGIGPVNAIALSVDENVLPDVREVTSDEVVVGAQVTGWRGNENAHGMLPLCVGLAANG